MGIVIDKRLLINVKEYMENMEEILDAEFGHCRDKKELINKKQMPNLYYEICNILKSYNYGASNDK